MCHMLLVHCLEGNTATRQIPAGLAKAFNEGDSRKVPYVRVPFRQHDLSIDRVQTHFC